MIGYGNSMFLATHGILAKSASGAAVDPDAQAFITAASITDPTQQSAINQLVVDLKGYNIWSKMKAIYPIVGGTAASHKWNLKDPRDLDAAFRLTFSSGWTHSANGMTPLNAYADTKLTPSTHLTLNNAAIGYYSRTNSNNLGVEIGARMASPNSDVSLGIYGTTPLAGRINTFADSAQLITTDTLGFYQVTRNGGSTQKVFKGTSSNSGSITTSTAAVNLPIFIGAMNQAVLQFYSNRQCAFSYISDGLTDTEAANLYTAVQTFQTTLGRSIGTQTVSDADAQAFVTAANIIDQVQANAINNLVIGLKADGLWTKIKAAYPIVGGTSASHYVNLKTPGTYNLSFSTGWTHSSTGATPNGAAYADTLFNPSALSQSLTSTHLSYYQRGNSDAGTSRAKMGAATNDTLSDSIGLGFFSSGTREVGIIGATGGTEYAPSGASAAAQGLFMINTNGNRNARHWKNGVANGAAVTQSGAMPNYNIYLAALNNNNFANVGYYHNKEVTWASIGDGLTDTEAANLYTRVQTFQTTLNRQV